jgi:hypothetical protein
MFSSVPPQSSLRVAAPRRLPKPEAMPRSKACAILSWPLLTSFAVPGKKFNAAAFNAKVNEGNAKFQQAIADEKFTARRPVLVNLKGQFDADAAHLQSKASRGKITPALATEMKNDVNKTYDHALGR